jgi:hypothetical protein
MSDTIKLIEKILTETSRIQANQNQNPTTIYLNTSNMQTIAEEASTYPDHQFGKQITVRHGDTGSLFGMKCVADDDIPDGEFIIPAPCCGGGPQWGHNWTCPKAPD